MEGWRREREGRERWRLVLQVGKDHTNVDNTCLGSGERKTCSMLCVTIYLLI